MIRVFLNSPVGGAGCSTLSANLAYTFARLGKKVLLTVEQESTIHMHFHSLNRAEIQSADTRFMPGYINEVAPNLRLRYAKDSTDHTSRHSVPFASNLPMGRQHESEYDIEIYDQVYLDPKGGFDESDWRLIVTTSTANSYLFLAKYFDRSYCDMSAQKKGRMLIVLNQHYPESVLSTDILDLMTETAGDSLFPGLFLYDELIRESAASGLPLLEYAPYSANQPLFELLGNHVVSQHAKHHAAA